MEYGLPQDRQFHFRTDESWALDASLSKEQQLGLAALGKRQLQTFSIMEWPADLRMYESQRFIILSEEAFNHRLDQEHRQALLNWVALGGKLCLVSDSKEIAPTAKDHMSGKILTIPDIAQLKSLSAHSPIATFLNKHYHDLSIVYPAPQLNFTNQEAEGYFVEFPSRFLAALFLISAFVISFFIVWKYAIVSHKRYRIFILVPGLSVLTTIVIAVFIVITDGIGGEGLRKTQIFLFPEVHSAHIRQIQICKTGVMPRHSFPIEAKWNLGEWSIKQKKEQNLGMTNSSSDQQTISIDPDYFSSTPQRNRSTAISNWFRDRSTLIHRIEGNVSTRARISLSSVDAHGCPVFQSSFPATLSSFVYRDSKGQFWEIPELEPGVKSPAKLLQSTEAPISYLRPGGFTAQTTGSAIDSLGPVETSSFIRWIDHPITVMGIIPDQSSNTR